MYSLIPANSHRVDTLEEGFKFTPISILPERAQFLEIRNSSVPQHMLVDIEKPSFSDIEQQSLEFVKNTLDTWVVCLEQIMNRALLMDSEKSTVQLPQFMALDRAIRYSSDADERVYDTRGLLFFLRKHI